MSNFVELFQIAAWPLVAILAMFLFKRAIRTFLGNAKLTSVKLFGVEIKTNSIKLAQVFWDNFNHFQPTRKQWKFLVQLSGGAISKTDAVNMGLDYKTDLRPLRNAGLIIGNRSTLNKSDVLTISSLGNFLVENARDQLNKMTEVGRIDVIASDEEDH